MTTITRDGETRTIKRIANGPAWEGWMARAASRYEWDEHIVLESRTEARQWCAAVGEPFASCQVCRVRVEPGLLRCVRCVGL